MRLIDGEKIETILSNAIAIQTAMAKGLGVEDDPEIKMEIKAYTDILNGIKEQHTIDTTDMIPIEWIQQQADIYPGMESAMWDKLIRLWEGAKNE